MEVGWDDGWRWLGNGKENKNQSNNHIPEGFNTDLNSYIY